MKRLFILITLFIPLASEAQHQLSLGAAIDTALRKNLDLRIAANEVDISRFGSGYGMAGGLPSINAGASDQFSLDNTHSVTSSGSDNQYYNVPGNNLNANITASIILFNGMKVQSANRRLNLIRQQSETEFNGIVQDLMAEVMLQYYNLVRQQTYLRILETLRDVSQQKVDIVNEKSKVGMASGADIMQAQSDLNTAGQNIIIQQLRIQQLRADFLLLINARMDPAFVLSDSIPAGNIPPRDSINLWIHQNPALLSAEAQVRINRLLEKETASQMMPSLKMEAGYGFSRSDNAQGNILLNQFYGPGANLTLQIPIFNGTIYRRRQIIAGIQTENARLASENLLNQLFTTAEKKYLEYNTAVQQIESQRENFSLSRKLLELTMLNFHHGEATILDVKAAQNSYETAAYQLINYMYAAKAAEIELRQLICRLGME